MNSYTLRKGRELRGKVTKGTERKGMNTQGRKTEGPMQEEEGKVVSTLGFVGHPVSA